MNHPASITVVTTPDPAADPRSMAVVLRGHAENDAIGRVLVLYHEPRNLESDLPELPEKVVFEKRESPVTISDLFARASHAVRESGGVAAVMDPRVTFSDEAAATRCAGCIIELERLGHAPLFAITRHPPSPDAILPIGDSGDAWVIARPVELPGADGFGLESDDRDRRMAACLSDSDLLLLNPCLDVALTEHGYRPAPAEGTICLPPTSTSALIEEAHPAAWSGRSKKLIFLPDDDAVSLPAVPADWDADLVILCPEPAIASWRRSIAEAGHDPQRVLVFPRPSGVRDTLDAILRDGLPFAERIAVATDERFATGPDIARCDALVIASALQPNPVARPEQPSCTLITSVFRSDPFIEGFLANITELQGYDESIEHILLLAATSDHERQLLLDHVGKHPNSLLVWNRKDPGLYECWNIGIRLARTPFVSNANVDDLRHPAQVATLVGCLGENPVAAVAASALVPFYSYTPDISTIDASEPWYTDRSGTFGYLDLARIGFNRIGEPELEPHNLPHCMPVWRRSLHETYGFFNEQRFGTFADWAFWLDIMRAGETGFLHPDPLSYYYINPTSHNRRGDSLRQSHKAVADLHIPDFLEGNSPDTPAPPPRKLHLRGIEKMYGQHRNSFNDIIRRLEPLDHGPGGIHMIPFIERQFVWGDSDGEAASSTPTPLFEPWIGILHCPFDTPPWFHPELRPELFLESDLWKRSVPACRGVICLSKDLKDDFETWHPEIPSLALKHPTSFGARRFSFREYLERPRLVQIGDWLRKLQAIYRIHPCGHEKIMLSKFLTKTYLDREKWEIGDFTNNTVKVLDYIDNDDYDSLMSSSVVLCMMYASAANNVILECIARATPIIVNPIPSVVEYLGPDYPLYAATTEEAELLLSNPDHIRAAADYLARSINHSDLTYDSFCDQLAASPFYAAL